MHLSIAGGVGNCGPAGAYPLGGAGRFEFGYRFGLFTLGAGTSLGGATYDLGSAGASSPGTGAPAPDPTTTTAGRSGTMVMVSADAFAMVNPLQGGRLDPFFAAGFGYPSFSDRAKDGTEMKAWIQAPSFRLPLGVPIFVGRGITLGPRLDQILPMGGARCTGTDNAGTCEPRSEPLERLEREQRQRARRDRERPWAAMLELRVPL